MKVNTIDENRKKIITVRITFTWFLARIIVEKISIFIIFSFWL